MARPGDCGGDWAHAPHGIGQYQLAPHLLDDHLREVGRLAQSLAPEPLQGLARLAGLWHDLGKRRPGFQRYIRQAGGEEAHIERVAERDKTHSAAGALWAEQWLAEQLGLHGKLMSRLLQYVIAGHHAGLDNWESGLAIRLVGSDALREGKEALDRPSPEDILRPDLAGLNLQVLPLKEHQNNEPGRLALWLRMLFSALVDAEFLDTEAYMEPVRSGRRANRADIPMLREACERYLQSLAANACGPVNRVRAQVLRQCREKASLPSGVFSLTVPTGGGKTLSSLAFALEHAAKHRKRRVVYAIPYTSIIEQTADVFRSVFASLGDVVIEHHSNAESEPEQENHLSRLACENWDAPLIVTTNVQLFESLFARKASRCRKLHNLTDSVIVLDEAQLLPLAYLQPTVDALRYLVQDFGVTLVLCTATQPVLNAGESADPARGLRRGLGSVTEIIDDVCALYQALERVQVRLPPSLEMPCAWPDLADDISRHEAALAIVNRRADAAALYRLLKARSNDDGSDCWHLSALMCAQHRSNAIAQIKSALAARRDALASGSPARRVYVVSTQLVEAGVDLDFPVVFRALAGLDSIAQAAGRCNREGCLPEPGQVHIFVPPTRSPPGLLTLARDTCKAVLHDLPSRPLALPRIERYFKRLLHDAASTDDKGIADMLKLQPDAKALTLPLRLRDAAEAFNLIDEKDAATVIVRYRSPQAREDIDALIGLLQRDGPSRWLLRKLQRYGVTIYQHQIAALLKAGDITELPVCPGLYVQREGWDGFYDPVLGARVDSAPGDPVLVV